MTVTEAASAPGAGWRSCPGSGTFPPTNSLIPTPSYQLPHTNSPLPTPSYPIPTPISLPHRPSILRLRLTSAPMHICLPAHAARGARVLATRCGSLSLSLSHTLNPKPSTRLHLQHLLHCHAVTSNFCGPPLTSVSARACMRACITGFKWLPGGRLYI